MSILKADLVEKERTALKTIRNPQQTRERLLQTAFQEMHAHGFQGMRVDEVLRLSGLQKGAFYHHFGSKSELGYAVLEEQIKPLIDAVWLAPFLGMEDPVREIPKLMDTLNERVPPAMHQHGCPLNNLAQEMAAQDDGFKLRIAQIFSQWIDSLSFAFETSKKNGNLRRDVDCRAAAQFVVAVLEGCISLYKVDPTLGQWTACRTQISAYLNALTDRP